MSRGYNAYSSSSKDSGPLDCKVYVGDLGQGASRNEIEDVFSKYGDLRNVWVARQPPGFAFVEFKDHRDALEAVDATDGMKLCGKRIRVEMSTGETRRGGRGGGGYRGGGRRSEESCYECGERGHYARSCPNSRSRHDRRGYGRSSRYRSKSRSRSRSRSYSTRRFYSRSRSRSQSRD